MLKELIETLWNVNALGQPSFQLGLHGINRNIVECKYTCSETTNMPYWELIETLWNVNLLAVPMFILSGIELIETLWNVN